MVVVGQLSNMGKINSLEDNGQGSKPDYVVRAMQCTQKHV